MASVLFKLKPDASPAKVAEWSALGATMVGKIPGLIKWDANRALPTTAHRAKGYDMGLVAVLEKSDDVLTYAQHPAHLDASWKITLLHQLELLFGNYEFLTCLEGIFAMRISSFLLYYTLHNNSTGIFETIELRDYDPKLRLLL
ncbi:hypothetical protein FHL15_001241 [Xylaria flabelliformis]|uniref:Stress-response A/B barrel domain-containing protein n=1 Tax=Xylaria flabelliformis TaxID=2512241 RepID=A0A553ICW1_9PEZI|nr:hypothetical protein FHL15_001241 [Xylaria flabelliformis]